MRRILTFLAAGTLALSACSDDTVGPPANYVFVVIPDQAALTMTQDDSVTVSAIVEDTISHGRMYNPDLDWSSDDEGVAVIEQNSKGKWQVRATGDGTTKIHVVFNAYHGPVEGTIDVSVTGVEATDFSLSKNSSNLFPGDADTISITLQDADGNDLSLHRLEWESSDDSVASVTTFTKVVADTTVAGTDTTVTTSSSYYAVVTAKKVGTADITATTAEGLDATVAVTVAQRPVASVKMSPDVAALHVGEKATITATPMGANGEALTGRVIGWTSTNTAVATVDSAGVVTAVGAGTTDIKALVEGKFGTTSVIVVAGAGN